MSELTQRSTSLPQQSLFSNKIDIARERFRQLRRELSNLSNPLRKFQKYNVEIIPSPFLDREGPWSGSPPLMAPAPFYQKMQTNRMPAMRLDPVMDGSADTRRPRPAQPQPCVSAIFVHAGAGYHSTTNEHIHLGACNE